MMTHRHSQTKVPLERLFRLPVSVISPDRTGSGAITVSVMKVIFEQFQAANGDNIFYCAAYMSGSTVLETPTRTITLSAFANITDVVAAVQADILYYASSQSYSITAADILWVGLTANDPPSESTPSLSIQTSTGAVGTQLSATRNGWLTVQASISTTATIGGASTGDIVVEVAPTNSATAGDWVQKGIVGNSQTVTLAVILQSIQVVKGSAIVFVPAGYYAKVRSVTGSGSPSYSILAQKFLAI